MIDRGDPMIDKDGLMIDPFLAERDAFMFMLNSGDKQGCYNLFTKLIDQRTDVLKELMDVQMWAFRYTKQELKGNEFFYTLDAFEFDKFISKKMHDIGEIEKNV